MLVKLDDLDMKEDGCLLAVKVGKGTSLIKAIFGNGRNSSYIYNKSFLMKLINILLEETGNSIKWAELSVQKLRDMGFDQYKDGVRLPSEEGEYKLIYGAAIVAKPGSR